MNQDETRYSETHVWIRKSGDVFVCGITDYAQDSLSDIVYIELPEEGQAFKKGEPFSIIESVKAVIDLDMPMSGTIVAVNEDLDIFPEAVNLSPYSDGWLVTFKADDTREWEQLLNENEYQELLRKNC